MYSFSYKQSLFKKHIFKYKKMLAYYLNCDFFDSNDFLLIFTAEI